jgi:hypothetical protein
VVIKSASYCIYYIAKATITKDAIRYSSVSPRFPSFCLYYIRKAGISQMCENVAGSSPKGRGKGLMVKEGCFLPQKHEKPLIHKDFCVRVQKPTLYLREAQHR